MKNYLNIIKIWIVRERLHHNANIKIFGYRKMLVVCPTIITIIAVVVLKVDVKLSANQLSIIPILEGIFITYLFNLKLNFQMEEKYKKYEEINLTEKNKESSNKFRVFDEILAPIEFSILLLILSFISIFVATVLNENFVNIICLCLFAYAFIFSIYTLENFSNRIK